MDIGRRNIILGDLGILLVAFIWGSANVAVRDALSGVTPLWFCALRFAIACPVLMALFGRRAMALPGQARRAGLLIGTIFVSAYLLGAVALLYTTAGNESFIISMSVVFVPVVVWILTKKFPGWHIVVSVALCIAGMAGLVLDEALRANAGDIICFSAMLCVTANILLVQRCVQDVDPVAFACWQSFGGMLLALAAAFTFEPLPVFSAIPAAAWGAVVYTATIGFALTLVLQNAAQKYTTATHAAILLSTSSVFGSAGGIVLLGEPMTSRIFIASALILTGVLVAEAVPAIKSKKALTELSDS